MDRYQRFLRKMAIKPLLPALIALIFVELIGGLFFHLDPMTIFVWFAAAFIAYYSVLIVLSVVGALVYAFCMLGTPAIICLIIALAVLVGSTYVFITKTDAVEDVMQMLEDANVPDEYLNFLKKAETTDEVPETNNENLEETEQSQE